MYRLNVSKLAHQDLDKIVSYVAINLASPSAATDLLNKVAECYAYLKDNPFMYAKCQDKQLEEKGCRKVSTKSYVLVYKINENARTVNILRFFYGAQDYVKLI
ncbi:MAG: type II toxin-antitoxin system RelE/ParE family toxin [Dethiobacteria bacterium]|jgi:toxin ParE1/3/4